MNEATIAVVIVNYNSGALLSQCVSAVLGSTIPVEIWVVDNHSQDGSLAALPPPSPRLHIVQNMTNRGFAAANNQALQQINTASIHSIVLLNPDCIIHADTLERLEKQILQLSLTQPVGMAGCLILNPDGTEQRGCRRRIPTPWRVLMQALPLQYWFPQQPVWQGFLMNRQPLPTGPVPVEAISGAFMWVKREALQAVGGLDEGYFLHAEDLDWCLRFQQAGWPIIFIPDITVTHIKGACSRQRPLWTSWQLHQGMMRFYRKFFWPTLRWPWRVLLLIGIYIRFGVAVIHYYLMKKIVKNSKK